MRGMSSTSPCSKSTLSRISLIRLSSRCRAKMTGRWPSLTNLRLVSAPMTPMPPVIRTFMSSPAELRHQGAGHVVEQRIDRDLLRDEALPRRKIDDDLQRRPARLDPEAQRIELRAVGRRFERALAGEQHAKDLL